MKPSIPTFLAACLLAAACTPYQQQGAALGALGGAAVGAITGDHSEDVVRGAAIGAAIGTGAAALQEQSLARPRDPQGPPTQPGAGSPPPSTPPSQTPQDYPVARRTAKPTEVISPYPPYNVIDVTGFRPGQLARDPSNQKIFRVP